MLVNSHHAAPCQTAATVRPAPTRRWRWLRWVAPKIDRADLRPMLAASLVAGFIAGLYGALHDQFTYAISPEYFTKVKFDQFQFADLGWGNRAFVSTIGFLATAWVGAATAWFLARRLVPNQPRAAAYYQIAIGVAIVFFCGLTGGAAGSVYGMWRGPDGDYSAWLPALRSHGVRDVWSLIRVAYVHNGGYLGGLVGLVVALAMIPRAGRA